MIERIRSFLAKKRLPQLGHDESNEIYSVNFDLFQL